MFPASLAACVPVFIATPTSACASAGASFVPSPVIATSRPPSCSRLMRRILSSGVASARKSSTPASVAMAVAVSGLSPVIITVRMPMRRSSSNRSEIPCFTTSLRWITPRIVVPSATARGSRRRRQRPRRWTRARAVPRRPAPRPNAGPVGGALADRRPSMSTPLMRVCAVKGTSVAPTELASRNAYFSFASTTIERPSGVSSERLASCAASASSSSGTPGSGRNSAAWRLPSVIVPVLSSSSVAQSPAASTARPDIASTLRCTSRSMPAMPMAESRAPIVVGMRHTSSATRITMSCSAPE